MGGGPRDWTPSGPEWDRPATGGSSSFWYDEPGTSGTSPFAEIHRRRRRRLLAWLWTGTGLLIVLLVVVVGGRLMPFAAREGLVAAVPVAATLVGVPSPASEVADLAHRTFLTERGRELFYATAPRLLGDEVAQACDRPEGTEGDEIVAVGCYAGWVGPGRMYIYRPSDPRLAGSMVTTAAHELLHAIYDRMDAAQQTRVDELVAADTARLAPDDPTRAQIDWSVGSYESARGTEQFAYLGSQVLLDGGFAAELESIYAQWFTDRAALVEVYRVSLAQLEDLTDQLSGAWEALAAHEQAVADARAQYDADRTWHEQAVGLYNDDLERFAAMSSDESVGWTATFTTRSGQELTMPLADALTYRHDELEDLKADLEARLPAIEQQAADAAAERIQAEALEREVINLLDAAYPGRS